MNALSMMHGGWASVERRLGEVADLEATARRFGALKRVRKIRDAGSLLRLALLYGPGQLSLRGTAAAAGEAAIAEMSDKAVLGRLRGCGDWLAHLLYCLLEQQRGRRVEAGTEASAGLDLVLVDGSVICQPGSKGSDWRLHARYEPARGGFTDFVLTTGRVAERADRTVVGAGQTMVFDRGFARVRDLAAVLAAGSGFVTRIGWRSLQLHDPAGARIDLMALLPADLQPVEHVVHLKQIQQPLRLVIQRAPPEQAAAQQRRVVRRASRKGNKLDQRSTIAAGYLFLLTSLPAASQPAAQIVTLYRHRWQVELGFKRLKSLGGLGELPATDPALARTWLLAQLIAAVLTDDIAHAIVGFPPSAESASRQAA